ncbi:MAG: alpha/beta hydrolase [Chloroflexota bacterium]
MRTNPLLVLATAAIVAACGPTGSAPAPSGSASPSAATAVAWSPCHEGLECGSVDVPLDYGNPGGATIPIALVRIRAGDPGNRIGSLLYNPGGPGASGVDAVARAGTRLFPADVRARFDIVGFDPRGVAASGGVHCLDRRPTLNEAYPTNGPAIARWEEAAKEVAGACAQNDGPNLAFLGTDNAARDLDRVRAALGDEKLSYVGASYGTLLGAAYAHLFPTNVRALVLDAPLDPSLSGSDLIAGQAAGFEDELGRFLDWCPTDTRCTFASGGLDARTTFETLLARFGRGPVAGVSANTAMNGIANGLARADWPALSAALDQALHNDGSGLAALAGPFADPAFLDPFDAVACLDLSVGHSLDAYAELADRLVGTAPDFGGFLAYSPGWGSIECAYWPVPPQRTPAPVTAPGVPPVLIVAGTHDPETPYPWGEALSKQLRGSVLLTRDGDGHGSYARSACIAGAVDAYLLELRLPPAGTICR